MTDTLRADDLADLEGAADEAMRFIGADGGLRADRDALDTLYEESGIFQRLIDLPVRDAFKQGWQLRADDEEEEWTADVVDALETLCLDERVKEARQQARLHGGAAIVLVTDDPGDLSEPLDLGNVRSLKDLRVLSRWELTPVSYVAEWLSPRFGEPETYSLNPQTQGHSDVIGATIHASRVIHLNGAKVSRSRRIRQNMWSTSVALRFLRSLMRWFGSADALGKALDENSYSVMGVKGLHSAASNEQTRGALIKRAQLVARTKRIGRVVMVDADGESWKTETAGMGGYADGWDRMASALAGDAGLPLTLLLGQAPSGLSTDDYGGRAYYYDSVRDEQGLLTPVLDRIIEVCCAAQDGPTGGNVPDKWKVKWEPLEAPTEGELSETRLRNAQADTLYLDRGVVTPAQIARERFAGMEYGSDVTLGLDELPEPDLSLPEPEPEQPAPQ